MVEADSEDEAKHIVHIEWPEATEWRFCEPRDTVELSDRFPITDWMVERFANAS
jgi:hypothetical protein